MSPSGKTHVVTDSTSYLPEEMIERYAIHEVSLYVNFDGEQARESEITDYDDFYRRLLTADEPATTSQPSVGDFLEVYEPLLADGGEIVSLHLSSGISGTYESACTAREQLIADGKGGERIHVFDSHTGAGATGLLILVAAKTLELGGSPQEALHAAQESRESLQIYFAVDTLEYLRRGGRIGAAQALLGSTLQIKPILKFDEEVTPLEKVRTRRRSIERLVEYAGKLHDEGNDAWVIQHVRDPESAAAMVEECRPVFGRDPILVSEIGPVIGAHVGPGLLGLGAIPLGVLADGV